MPGSAADPVQIGPFRRIVEVGWPSVIALKFRASASYTGPAGIACSPTIGDRPAGYEEGFIETSVVLYEDGGPLASWIRRNGEWQSIALDALDGDLPGSTPEAAADWSWVQSSSPFQQANPGGSLVVSNYPVPDGVGGTFSHGPVIGFDFLAHEITGAPQCYGNEMGGTNRLAAPKAETATAFRTAELDFSPLVATYLGKAYRPEETRMVDQPAVGTGWIDIYVLFKRSPADDPTA